MRRLPVLLIALSAAVGTYGSAGASPVPEQWRAQHPRVTAAVGGGGDEPNGARFMLPPGIRVQRNVAYGTDPAQRFDVYLPSAASTADAPVLVMVHGGGWRRGDKAAERMIGNKVARWVPRGFIVIAVNYPMLPAVRAYEQAVNVGQAVALAQSRAAEWGGNPAGFILMGHSAGAHLVSLLHAAPLSSPLRNASRIQPWLGTISLDTAALDVPQIMSRRHPKLYDDAFGSDPAYWVLASPYQAMDAKSAPLLFVCSTERPDRPCNEADEFARRARAFGTRAEVMPQELSHQEINATLGRPGAYTDAVEAFMRSLDPAVAARLAP